MTTGGGLAAAPTTGEGGNMKGFGTLFEAALAAIQGGYSHHDGPKEAEAYVIELEDGSFVGHVEAEKEDMIRKDTQLIVTPTGMKPAPGWINQFFKTELEEEEPAAKLPASPGYRFPEAVKVVVTRRTETPATIGSPLSDNELGVWLRPHTARIKMWGCYITPALWEALREAGSIPRLFDLLGER